MMLVLRPHPERGGYRLDRFDAYLDGDLIVTSRQPLYDGARRLLEMGHDPDALLTIRHDVKEHDSFLPRPLGELAQWTIEESDKGGLKRRRWKPFNASRLVDVASPASAEAVKAARHEMAACKREFPQSDFDFGQGIGAPQVNRAPGDSWPEPRGCHSEQGQRGAQLSARVAKSKKP